MNIEFLSESCAKISIDSSECLKTGINYDSFLPDNDSARLFLASIIAKLELRGFYAATSEKITAEIFEDNNGGMIIYIYGKGIKVDSNTNDNQPLIYAAFYNSSEEVIKCMKEKSSYQNITLYKFKDKYILISNLPILPNIISETELAKIKEYGKLLSNTPTIIDFQ